MKGLSVYLRRHGRQVIWLIVAVAVVSGLLLYKLGSLTGGLSAGELSAGNAAVGWHGIYDDPLYLPLKLVRSVVFVLFSDHGRLLTRLPNVLFGGLAIASFAVLVRLWHGTRTAILASLLFATAAWVLHASRLASFDVMYLAALPVLLLVDVLLQKYASHASVWYASMLIWGLFLYIPGMIWFVILNIFLQRSNIAAGWQRFSLWWQRALYLAAGLVWLPLLADYLARSGKVGFWLGLPTHLAGPSALLKQFAAVPVHLFIRGPQYPQLWLGRAPLVDIFTLAAALIGIYFYATHWRAARSQLLGLSAIIGVFLVGLGGPVGFSVLVPLIYITAATGLAYLLREWFGVFPSNPLARGLGLGLIILAVAVSCGYNLKAYFVAWPHNTTTKAVFRYRR